MLEHAIDRGINSFLTKNSVLPGLRTAKVVGEGGGLSCLYQLPNTMAGRYLIWISYITFSQEMTN